MHTINSFHPSPELRPFVRAYAQRLATITGSPLLEQVPARLEQTLEFQFGDSFHVYFDNGSSIATPRVSVIGPQTDRQATVSLYGDVESFAVFFHPAGFSQIFGIPMREIINEGLDGASILGQNVQMVWNELGECSCFRARVAIVERFLLEAVRNIRFHDRMAKTANRVLAMQGRISVLQLAHQEGLGLRHFERIFTERVGVPPKRFARVARLQSALDLKVAAPSMSWLQISHRLAYHDQMHMIHDFRSLCGNSPGRVLEQMGDMRPDALVAAPVHGEKSGQIFTMRLR